MYKVIKNPFERFTQKGAASALCMCLLLAGSFTSCSMSVDKPDEEGLSQDIYYVVGYDGNVQVDSLKGTAKAGAYLFVSENLKDSLFASNLIFESDEYQYHYDNILDDIIDFPMESMYNWSCGERFFSEEYRFAFKVQINSYRPMTEEEFKPWEIRVYYPAICNLADYHRFKYIVITSISKIQ